MRYLIKTIKFVEPLIRQTNYKICFKIKANELNSRNIYMSAKQFKNESKDNERDLKDLVDIEQRVKKIMSEYVDPSSPFIGLIERWTSKPWLKLFGDKVKTIKVKKITKGDYSPMEDSMFRLAFDLTGYKPKDIRIIISDTKLYIEAKKEEESTEGSKAWREFSYESKISSNVDRDQINATLDSGGLLVIEGHVPRSQETTERKKSK